jgi:taurine dioxygenase
MLDARPLSETLVFGSMVRGLTLEQLTDEAVRSALRDLWYDRGVLVFRGGDDSVEFQIRLSEVFGPLVCHQQPEKWVKGHKELVSLTSDPKIDITVERDGEIRVGALPWHGDARWLAEPPHGGLLKVRRMPRAGGETGFIDLISTYERLSEDLKRRIEGRHTIVHFAAEPEGTFSRQVHKVRVLSMGEGIKGLTDRNDFPPILQDLVYVQPQTGRKVLGFTPLPKQQVEGMSPDESEALLKELSAYATDERYAYVHSYQEGDLVLWDNLRMLHCAFGVPPGEEREIWRTTIGGGQPIARPLEGGSFTWKQAAQA